MAKQNRGFTLIELLVVIAIIGLLANMAVMSIQNARLKSRNTRRIADVSNIQKALELYFSSMRTYPPTPGTVLGGSSALTLSSGNGFAATASGDTFMVKVPADPGIDSGSYAYTYTLGTASTYTITFGITEKTGRLTCATYSATCCRATESTGIACN